MSADNLDDATLDLADATLDLHDEAELLRAVMLHAASNLRCRGPYMLSRDEVAGMLERAAGEG